MAQVSWKNPFEPLLIRFQNVHIFPKIHPSITARRFVFSCAAKVADGALKDKGNAAGN